MKYKLIIEARNIPLGSTVTKRIGSKEYMLGDRLRVFDRHGNCREVLAEPGALFLIDNGNANAISTDLELVWVADESELRNLVDPEENK